MAGPSLSHILDPPRPPASATSGIRSSSASGFAPHDPAAQTSSIHGPGPIPVGHAPTPDSVPSALSTTSTHSQTRPDTTPSGTNHNGKNLYACRDCGRSYSRPEHLVRHVQTHTLGRRFVCDVCQKSFARKDLLRRHVANHDNDSPKKRRRTTVDPGAGRVSHACRPCAVARVKCDDSKPCRRCVNRNLTCVSSEAGSTAAMHLVHFAANAHTAVNSSGDSPSGDSIDSSSPASTSQPRSTPVNRDTPNKNTPLSQASYIKPEESQLPTPDTATEQAEPASRSISTWSGQLRSPDTMRPEGPQPGNPEHYASTAYEPPSDIMDMTRMPFFDFLRDVLYEQPYDPLKHQDSQGLAVLDFCSDSNLEMTDMDFGLLDHWNMDGGANFMLSTQSAAQHLRSETPNIPQLQPDLLDVWTDSPWRWNPGKLDTGYREQDHLPISAQDTSNAQFQESQKQLKRVTEEKLDTPGRDKILALVLGTCRQNSAMHKVVSSFPPADVMDTLVHIFLAAHSCQVSEWIHFPTFKLSDQWPEWITVAAGAGGVLTPQPTLRKFGFALQEAVRVMLPARFEENNTAIENLGLVQSFILWTDLGLWSGNRRKMEIAECHLVIPVTMMRYRGRFQRSTYPTIVVDPSDEGEVLEEKWKLWVSREQWKRLSFHCYVRDAEASMLTLTNTCMSYSELTLPLPQSRELWFAKNAKEWKAQYLQRNISHSKRAPSVGDLFHDVHLLQANSLRIDMQFSISIFLHGFWALILEYRQLSAVHRSRSYANSLGGTPNLLLSSRHQELVKDLQSFQLIAADWKDMSAQEHLLLNALMMNLHVSLDDMQLFSGKEGEDQARRVYPVLQQWAASSEARSAVWCAGQIIRYAKFFPPGHLKDFYAVAVHHASLALWTYGIVTRANRRQQMQAQYTYNAVYLDGSDSISIQRFIGFDQGRPMITGPLIRGSAAESSLLDPRACMDIMQDVLRSNFSQGHGGLPPIVENLCQMIKQLGNAAWAVGLR